MRIATRIIAVAVAAALSAGGVRLYAEASGRPAAAPAYNFSGPLAPVDDFVAPRPVPRQVEPPPAPEPPKVEEQFDPRLVRGKLIEASIKKQELTAWENGVVVYRFKISTGRRGYATPTGHFRVHTKYENRWSRKWKVWMPYAMFWHPRWGYAFHELPYRSDPERRIGASRLGRRDSHGCVRINVGDGQRLYEWAPVGTEVWIH